MIVSIDLYFDKNIKSVSNLNLCNIIIIFLTIIISIFQTHNDSEDMLYLFLPNFISIIYEKYVHIQHQHN